MVMENRKILIVVVRAEVVVAAIRSLDLDDRFSGILIILIIYRILRFWNFLISVFYNDLRADFRSGVFIRTFIRISNDLDFQSSPKESLRVDCKSRFCSSFVNSDTGYDNLCRSRMDIVFIGNAIAYILRQGCKAVAEHYFCDLRLLFGSVISPGALLQCDDSVFDRISHDRICLLRFYRTGGSLFCHFAVNLFANIRRLDRVGIRLPRCCTGRCLNYFLLIPIYPIPGVNVFSVAAAFICKSHFQICFDPCGRRNAVSDLQIQISGKRRKRNDFDVVSPAWQRFRIRCLVTAGQIFHAVAVLDFIVSDYRQTTVKRSAGKHNLAVSDVDMVATVERTAFDGQRAV